MTPQFDNPEQTDADETDSRQTDIQRCHAPNCWRADNVARARRSEQSETVPLCWLHREHYLLGGDA